ncbi:DUF916 and DUF3324 domain-containing protein [Enterococcus faecalis]|uniref:DUF916 and DUF3324 domain-containing protein n=1 Tax=Enterococcus faecalis TaxID=1351 RepID=UPI00067AEFF6
MLVSLTHGTVTVKASEFSFSVNPVTPKNQIDKDKTYFDIQLDPNQKEDLMVELRNDTDKEVIVDISLNSATTNSNVVVEYGKNDIKSDDSLTHDISDFVEYPETVTLQPKSNQIVKFSVKMPTEKFDGVLAGGITFKEQINEKEHGASKDQGLSIRNEYSYVVALLMRQSLTEVLPNLNLKEVAPGQINARNVILAKVQNDTKTYINQVTIKTQIIKKGSKDILYQEEKGNLQIAPNTTFSFPTSLNGKPLEAGEYHLSMTILGNENEIGEFSGNLDGKSKKYENQWLFEQDFKINGKVAKDLNTKDVTIKNSSAHMYILVCILLLIFVLLVALLLIWRRKKSKKEKQ